jgi:hypothetical protein
MNDISSVISESQKAQLSQALNAVSTLVKNLDEVGTTTFMSLTRIIEFFTYELSIFRSLEEEILKGSLTEERLLEFMSALKSHRATINAKSLQ